MLRQIVGSCSLAKKRDVSRRRVSIVLQSFSDVGHDLEGVAVCVLCLKPNRAIAAAGHALGRIQAVFAAGVRATQSVDAMAVTYMVTTLIWLLIALRFVNPTQLVTRVKEPPKK